VQLGRARMGCLASLLLAFAVAVGVVLLLFPWAFNIGGRFTPMNVWTGYGRLHSSAGATYGLYARLMLPARGGRAGNGVYSALPNVERLPSHGLRTHLGLPVPPGAKPVHIVNRRFSGEDFPHAQ
jgi:hypothetical protein